MARRHHCHALRHRLRLTDYANVLEWSVHSVPDKMILEMQIGMEIGMKYIPSSGFFSNEPFEIRPVTSIQDFDFHSDEFFESHLFERVVSRILQPKHKSSPVPGLTQFLKRV